MNLDASTAVQARERRRAAEAEAEVEKTELERLSQFGSRPAAEPSVGVLAVMDAATAAVGREVAHPLFKFRNSDLIEISIGDLNSNMTRPPQLTFLFN
jgi:hypothetical protein